MINMKFKRDMQVTLHGDTREALVQAVLDFGRSLADMDIDTLSGTQEVKSRGPQPFRWEATWKTEEKS